MSLVEDILLDVCCYGINLGTSMVRFHQSKQSISKSGPMRVLHSDLGWDCGVLVDGVVDFVLGAGAHLDWGVVLLVTVKTADR